MKFRTQYSDYSPSLEDVSSESETVPDMSLSVKDILKRFTRGTLTEQELFRQGSYDDDPDIDNPYDPPSDLTDYESMAQRGRDILRDIDIGKSEVSREAAVAASGATERSVEADEAATAAD